MPNAKKKIRIDLRNKPLHEIVAVLNAIIAARAILQEQGKQLTIKKRKKPAKNAAD